MCRQVLKMWSNIVVRMAFVGLVATLVLVPCTFAFDATSSAALDFHRDLIAAPGAVLLGMDVDEPESTPEPAATVPAFGTEDSWRLNIILGGGFAFDEDQKTTFGYGGASFSYFLIDDFSLDFEFYVMGFEQPGTDAAGFNFNLMVRWHIIARPTWSFYVEGGAGLLLTTANLPPDAQIFNFTPQLGAGFTFEIATDTRMFVGVRLHHISNANLNKNNRGLDNAVAYAGISIPF